VTAQDIALPEAGRAILTVAEIAEADRAAAAAGTPTRVLLERAGRAVAEASAARFPGARVLVLCGPGDNGGDGYVAARMLRAGGVAVTLAASVEREALKGAAAEAAADWTDPVVPLARLDAAGVEADVVVDALFGAGLRRRLAPPVMAVLKALQDRGVPLVAVDLPSGLAGDTGAPIVYAPQAALTVTFHRKKPAHVLEPGRSLCGEIVLADIGLDPPQGAKLFENGPALWQDRLPWPRTDTYKTERGRMVVVSGPAWSTGAARLSARAGLRAGAGLVTLLSPPDALAVNAAHLEAVMLKPFEGDGELHLAADDADVAVIGPAAGVGAHTRANLMALARTGAALVVDADALTSFRETPQALFSALDRDDVLTPHPGEFARVFPGLLKDAPERITAARQAAERAGAVVLLKGADTVVAASDGRAVVNTNAVPWLATAGSGDVLAGIIAGLIAQGMDSFEAACAGAWMHGEAGRGFGPGLISEDLPDRLPAVLAALYAQTRPVGAG
jgi:hydroxyethylthiazole kinase-like uncharacterized protein yjeF